MYILYMIDHIMRFLCCIQRHSLNWKNPDSKVHGANMGPNWGRQDPGGPHDGPMNIAIWGHSTYAKTPITEQWADTPDSASFL